MPAQKLQIHADEDHPLAAQAASSSTALLLVFKYLTTFVTVIAGVLAGHLDQTIRGLKLGAKKYKAEIIFSEDTGA